MVEEKSRLRKIVEEHNALQPRRRRMRAGMMLVRIREAGRYNDGEGKAADYAVGDELETHEWYARELVADGLAEWPVVPVEEAIAVEEAGGSELAEVLPVPVIAMLAEWGIRTVAEVRAAPDDKLLAVPGIGAGRLKRLREIVGQ